MTQETDIFNLFIKLTPPGLALLLWAYGVYNQCKRRLSTVWSRIQDPVT